MRRALALVLVAAMIVLFAAGAVFAQKDPFEPGVTPEGQTRVSRPAPTFPEPGRVLQPSRPGAALPRTGIDADVWFQAALFLLIGGALLLSLERYRRFA